MAVMDSLVKDELPTALGDSYIYIYIYALKP